MDTINIFWFRRDLRLNDNAGLYYALKDKNPVLPLFIFDKNILDKLEEKADRRVEFICNALNEMQQILVKKKSSLEIYYDHPESVFKKILKKYKIEKVFTNHDYEPYAIDRDNKIKKILSDKESQFITFKDQVIFEKDEILKDNSEPYTVFTPFSRKWKSKLNNFYMKEYPVKKYFSNIYKQPVIEIPSPSSMGFIKENKPFPGKDIPESLLKNYEKKRNFPSEHHTSKISVHLRFGTISIRELAKKAKKFSDVFLNELIWRDFYQYILWHFPRVGHHKTFKPEYENIKWRNNEQEFKLWCTGQTGYPIVDAGMRELNKTGFMHNRVRMITASFLSKHLLIDWRWGEAYFAEKLLDFDLASNNGGWQWSAGSGNDASPYFRIFNPELQTKKFDKDLKYITKWVPEFQEFSYPKPVVEHEFARKRCLEVYTKAVKGDK